MKRTGTEIKYLFPFQKRKREKEEEGERSVLLTNAVNCHSYIVSVADK